MVIKYKKGMAQGNFYLQNDVSERYVWKPRFYLIYVSPYISGLYFTLLPIPAFLKLLLLVSMTSCYVDFSPNSVTLLRVFFPQQDSAF